MDSTKDLTVDGARIVRWSHSALNKLTQCGEAFRRQYLDREWVPRRLKQARGSVVHRSVMRSMTRKLERGVLPPLEEVLDQAATDFAEELRGDVEYSPDERKLGVKAAQEATKGVTLALSRLHREKVAPVLTPVGVERRIIVKPRNATIEVGGTLDLVTSSEKGEAVRDTKTAEKSPRSDLAERSTQLTLYAMVRAAETGKLPAWLALDYLVCTPVRQDTKHVELATTRTIEDLEAMVLRLNMAVEAVHRGVFLPASADAWWCSASWCDFYSTCPYVRRGADRPRT